MVPDVLTLRVPSTFRKTHTTMSETPGFKDKDASAPTWLELATSRSIVLRSLLIAAIVGSVLCAINHGACVVSGKFNKACLFQSLLTAVVPYIVSVVSSVYALKKQAD